MANSRTPGSETGSLTSGIVPARTPGPLGMNDAADPNSTAMFGDTPGSLGINDGATPLGMRGQAAHTSPNQQAQTAATLQTDVWVAWTPPLEFADLYTMLAQPTHEDNIPYMYPDSKGNVTVGIGTCLKDAAAAKALRFYKRATVIEATDDEIGMEYDNVHGSPKKEGKIFYAPHYLKLTTLEMTPSDRGEQTIADIKSTIAGLKQYFVGFADYPAPAQRALVDIAYQYGPYGASVNVAQGKLKKWAESGDWASAAAIKWPVGTLKRAQDRQDLFTQAATLAKPQTKSQ